MLKHVETFKISQFPWFLSVSVFDDDPQLKLGDLDHNWTTNFGSTYLRRLKIQVYIIYIYNVVKTMP